MWKIRIVLFHEYRQSIDSIFAETDRGEAIHGSTQVAHGRIRCRNHRQSKSLHRFCRRITDRHSNGVPFLWKIRSWRMVWKTSKSYRKFICKKCKKMLALVMQLWYHSINNKANTLYKHNTFLIGGKFDEKRKRRSSGNA